MVLIVLIMLVLLVMSICCMLAGVWIVAIWCYVGWSCLRCFPMIVLDVGGL